MSTKIHNGYILTDYPSLYVLKLRMERLRRKIQRAMREELLKLTAAQCVKLIDNIALGKNKESINSSILLKSIFDIQDKYLEIEKTQKRDPVYDFYFDIVILPIKDKILAMIYCERNFSEILGKVEWLKPYPYWNNSDKPDNVSDEEWDQREVDWDKALGKNSVPAQNGFTVTFTMPFLYYPSFPGAETVLKYIPTFDDRLKKLTNRSVIDILVKEQVEKNNGEYKNSFFFGAIDSLEKPAYKELIEKTKAEIYKKIPKEITKEMLLEEIKENLKTEGKILLDKMLGKEEKLEDDDSFWD